MSAPSMREIPIEHNPVAIEIVSQIIAGHFDAVVLLTGVGTEALFEVARSQGSYERLCAALQNLKVIIRGPKPAAVLSKAGLKYDIRAPEPNTWKELLRAIDQAEFSLQGKRIVVQEYGLPNVRMYEELQIRGAAVTACPVYRWALPEDTGPLRTALQAVAAAKVDVVLFTSANQVTSVMEVAAEMSLLDDLRSVLSGQVRVASIGPACSEALTDHGFPVHGEASPPKMAQLVRVAMELAASAQ